MVPFQPKKKKPESADENEEKKKKVANILCPIFAINLHRFSPQITHTSVNSTNDTELGAMRQGRERPH